MDDKLLEAIFDVAKAIREQTEIIAARNAQIARSDKEHKQILKECEKRQNEKHKVLMEHLVPEDLPEISVPDRKN